VNGPAILHARVGDHLQSIRERHLMRVPRVASGIDLSSNDYLGLSTHPLVKARAIEAIERDGCGSTGSRLLRGHREVFEVAERAFATFKRSERALYFSSGYLANLAVLTTFAERGDVILLDQLCHASLRDGARLSQADRVMFNHNDADSLAAALASARGHGQTFVVTESLFSMEGDIPPLREFAAMCRESGAALIVDEAHAVGVYGKSGSGLIEEAGVEDDVFVSVNTAGKALGVAGAFVAGPEWAIEYLLQRARTFVFSTAPSPALPAALCASIALVDEEPQRRVDLRDKSVRLRDMIEKSGVPVAPGESQILPVILGDTERTLAVAAALQADGFDVRGIRPPTVPVNTARLRISVNVGLTDAQMERFVLSVAAAVSASARCHAVSS
jgi:8-amino-7-oxononanoate synthase